MSKQNLILNTVAVLETKDALKAARAIPVEVAGADKIMMEGEAAKRLLALLETYPFEEVLEALGETKGAA